MSELRQLNDESMQSVVGRSGLTIDIESALSIAEIAYVDAGTMYWKNFSFTGINGGLVDNIRATVDSTDGTETLAAGFSDLAWLASVGYLDSTEADVAWALSQYSDGVGGYGKKYNDGDLVIHVTSTDFGINFNSPSPLNGVDQAANLLGIKNAIDFRLQTGDFGLRSTDGLVETSLSQNFSVKAYLGYLDIVLTNNGNGFHDTSVGYTPGKPKNIRLADSYIGVDVKFRVDDLDIDNTNNANNTIIPRAVTNPGLTLRNMRIHNERGFDTLGSFGFASVESKIGAAMDIVASTSDLAQNKPTYVDGQAIYDVNVKWDWDLPQISFGDTPTSIGAVYFTDFHINNTSLVISAH